MSTYRALFLATIVASTFVVAQPDETAHVILHGVDQFGKGLGPVKVLRFIERRARGRDFAASFSGSEAQKIPFGQYIVSAQAGGVTLGAPIDVSSGESFFLLSGSGKILDYAVGATPILRGRIKGLPKEVERPVWLRVFSLYQETGCCKTQVIAEDGSFSFGFVPAGDYILSVLSDSGVLYSGQLRVENPRSELVVDLEANSIGVRPIQNSGP